MVIHRLGWVALTIILAPVVALSGGQRGAGGPASTATGTGFILGQVVDATTGRGIPSAIVVLAAPVPPPGSIGELTESRPPTVTAGAGSQRTMTAADGRFLFRNLTKGRFSIGVSSPSYVAGVYGQLRPQGPGQSIELGDADKLAGVTIKMWRNGSINGTVRDENGEPAVGVSVECSRRVFTGGQRRYVVMATGTFSDDRGVYRVPNLPPGDYICGNALNPTTVPVSVAAVAAAGADAGGTSDDARRLANSQAATTTVGARVGDFIYSSGASSARAPVPPPPDASGRTMTYAPVYYGGSATTAQATVIAVKPGEDRAGIDLQLKLVPAVRVSGRLVGPEGPVGLLGLSLLPASGNDMVSEGQAIFSRTTSDASGAFTLIGIPSGEYVLKSRLYPRPAPGGNLAAAQEEATLWVSAPITVGAQDIANLTVPVRYGLRVAGRVEFVGARQATPAEMQRVGIRMQAGEGRTSSPIALDGRVQADGTFKTSGYPAGRYIANVLPSTVPPGWFVRSITINSRDVSVEPLELVDADVSGMVVTFTDKTTVLSGTVTGPSGPDPTAEIVVFPADSFAWKEVGAVARRSRVDRADKNGRFVITGLAPGDYFVAAAAGTLPGDRQDPALLAMLMRDASRVTLTDGGTATVQLAVKR